MKDFVQFAQTTAQTVSEILPFPVSVSDENGYIVADTNQSRIGTFHAPSIEVIKRNKVLLYTKEKAAKMENVLPGVAVPLIYNEKPIGVLGIIGDVYEVEPFAYLVKNYVEKMWEEALNIQVENLEMMTLESFIQYVLLNPSIDPGQLNHYCEMFQLDPGLKRICIIIDIGDFLLKRMKDKQHNLAPDRIKKILLDCVERAYGVDEQSVCAFLNAKRIVLLKTETNPREFMRNFKRRSELLREMLETYHIEQVVLATGMTCTSLEHITQSFREADNLTKLGTDVAATHGVYSYYNWDVLTHMFLKQVDAKAEKMVLQRLKPLTEDEAFEVLKENFIAYCDSGMNISKAAKTLFIHRNTLIYRLKKIKNLTGLDTNRFEHCTTMYLVLKNSGAYLS